MLGDVNIHRERVMRHVAVRLLSAALLLGCGTLWAAANSYDETIDLFRHAGQSASFFQNSYAYAVFPSIGEGGLGVGGAYGKGRVYVHGAYVADTSMTQLSVGAQAGGQAYSQIIFFQDQRAFREFTKGNFEFGAGVDAVVITAAAGASAGTSGATAEASGGMKDARTAGHYYKGMAVFTIVKGGAMYQATLNGQKFSYRARSGE
jgi:lipid-binding SYLF domain-containing protein